MGAEAQVVCQQSVPVLEVQCFAEGTNVCDVVEDVVAASQSLSPRSFDKFQPKDLVSPDFPTSHGVSSLILKAYVFLLIMNLGRFVVFTLVLRAFFVAVNMEFWVYVPLEFVRYIKTYVALTSLGSWYSGFWF